MGNNKSIQNVQCQKRGKGKETFVHMFWQGTRKLFKDISIFFRKQEDRLLSLNSGFTQVRKTKF